jgi:hypothetical protein
MILGMSTSTFTLVHVILSLIGIVTGLVVMFGFWSARIFTFWNRIFLVTTIATSATGFLFPFGGITPGIVVGIVSLVVLALAIVALRRGWMKTYVITASLAEFLNVLVLIVQSFQKVPALHAYAPTGSEPVVKISQLVVLLLFIAVTVIAVRRQATASPVLKRFAAGAS